jgi:hypothetical protein
LLPLFARLGFGFALGGGGKRDGEVEFGEERAREVRVDVAAFKDDAVEFAVGDGDGVVGFLLAAGGKTGEEFGVEERNPGCLRRAAPVQEGEEGSG